MGFEVNEFGACIQWNLIGRHPDCIARAGEETGKQKSLALCVQAANPKLHLVGFEVLTAVSMKIAVFWVVAPCSHQTTRCYNPEDSNLSTFSPSTEFRRFLKNTFLS
jgi:hypothetical protein